MVLPFVSAIVLGASAKSHGDLLQSIVRKRPFLNNMNNNKISFSCRKNCKQKQERSQAIDWVSRFNQMVRRQVQSLVINYQLSRFFTPVDIFRFQNTCANQFHCSGLKSVSTVLCNSGFIPSSTIGNRFPSWIRVKIQRSTIKCLTSSVRSILADL